MRGQPVAENLRLFELAAPARAVLARQGQDHRLVLPGAVAQALEVVVETVNARDGFARGLHRAEGENVAEVTRVDVLLSSGRRVEVEVAVEVTGGLQDLRDVRRARFNSAHDLRDVARAPFVERENLLLLRAVLGGFFGLRYRRLVRSVLDRGGVARRLSLFGVV